MRLKHMHGEDFVPDIVMHAFGFQAVPAANTGCREDGIS